jgi:hypothetical protein
LSAVRDITYKVRNEPHHSWTKTTYAAHHFDMLDESTQQSVTGVLVVTFAIIEGGLILFVHHYCDLTTQRTSESGEVTQICTQDDDVALRRVASLSEEQQVSDHFDLVHVIFPPFSCDKGVHGGSPTWRWNDGYE